MVRRHRLKHEISSPSADDASHHGRGGFLSRSHRRVRDLTAQNSGPEPHAYTDARLYSNPKPNADSDTESRDKDHSQSHSDAHVNTHSHSDAYARNFSHARRLPNAVANGGVSSADRYAGTVSVHNRG